MNHRSIVQIKFLMTYLFISSPNWAVSYQAIFSSRHTIEWSTTNQVIHKAFLCASESYLEVIEITTMSNQCHDLIKLTPTNNSFRLPPTWPPKILKSALQLILLSEQKLFFTRVKVLGVLDDLYAFDGVLGLDWEAHKIRLWAPTATQVKIHLYTDHLNPKSTHVLALNSVNGVWETELNTNWNKMFYQFEVTLFDPYQNKVVTHMVTDPYSISLSENSVKSQIVDLNDPATQPAEWSSYRRPERAFEDNVIYELHIRDFSMHDNLLPNHKKGKYTAFCEMSSLGNRHLRRLSKAGLTHIHLLPFFDIASVNERFSSQSAPIIKSLSDSASPVPQQQISKFKDFDGFNWGYDPLHYGAVEGSYSSNPNGFQRILEARQMIQCLHKQGLGVIMDVAFNHTSAAADDANAVLDKIVPAYYYRTDQNLRPHQSTCCPDTASERSMMQKLMKDTVMRFARHYQVDGFRFDLMGHHTVQNLKVIRKNLDELPQGSSIILYGEGWAFGSLHDQSKVLPMNQKNAAGTGVGTFNDRMRDAVRGGNFMHNSLADQGWTNGLFDRYSGHSSQNLNETNIRRKLFEELTDLVRLGLTGNLANYQLRSFSQNQILGSQLNYGGNPGAGYTLDPQESINYVSAHDNYTLWDQILAKAPIDRESLTQEQRLRMHLLALATVSFSQGIPFFHAGSEMLRSKSGDGDSYNSGDYFNKLDFSYSHNNWAVGLPIKEKNFHEWDYWKLRLKADHLSADTTLIQSSVNEFLKQLRLRKNYPALRMRSADKIIKKLSFLNTFKEKQRIPGLIVAHYAVNPPLLVILNPLSSSIKFGHPKLSGNWRLVPELNDAWMTNGLELFESGFRLGPLSYAVLTQ